MVGSWPVKRMKNRLYPLRLLAPIICLTVLAPGHGVFAQTRPLKILLTNDDGFDSNGLKVMRAGLIAAGHHVTVVAPATNQSSTSMSMTSGVLKVESKGDAVWAVHGTPTDAVMIGLAHVLRETPQDLVISGTNAGQNLGTSTNGSGTVSAAIAAARYGVPAIATSAGIGRDSASAYAVAATLVNQMIAALDASRAPTAKLLPDRFVINMNVPAVPSSGMKGIRWAALSKRSAYTRAYSDTGDPNEVRSRLTVSDSVGSEADTDLSWFAQGYVTLTLLDGDLSVSDASAGAAVTSRLSKLALSVPAFNQ
jgi:5'/3'-nucleotidase SurE